MTLPEQLQKPEQSVVLDKFKRIGGNRSVFGAKIIGLGEIHTNDEHTRRITDFIHAFAKDGDIVLCEGGQRGQPLDPRKTGYQFPQQILVFGWDNLVLNVQAVKMGSDLITLYDQAIAALAVDDTTQLHEIFARTRPLMERFHHVGIRQRNQEIIGAVEDVLVEHPSRRIFILAGNNHFLQDPALIVALEKYPYVLLTPDTPDESPEKRLAAARRHMKNLQTS